MIRFECDYAEGAHERVLQRLVETNLEQTPGYSEDHYCATARWYIRELCEDETVDVHFLVGGTQTNALVIAAALRPHQGVIAASTGHINVHETGAIESYGHKVLAVPCGRDGKISAQDVRNVYDAHWNDVTHEHMVQPGMVYISQPTENGTLYSKAELEPMWVTCRDCGLFLFIDGARLGYGLMSEACDLTVPDLARLCDAFYLGGTKQGLLGVQFCTMFEDGLYFRAAKEAVDHAMTIRRAFEDRGYPMLFDSYTNQQFPILPDGVLAELEKEFAFSFWEKVDEGHTAVRVCTSWATQAASVQALIAALDQVKEG